MKHRTLLLLLLAGSGAAGHDAPTPSSGAGPQTAAAAAATVETEEETPMTEPCRDEIRQLHAFFQAWFRGELEETDEAFARFSAVLDEAFELVSPAGRRMTRAEVLAGVRGAHGSSRETLKRVWTRDERVRAVGADLLLATYEEWQEEKGVERARLSTALFRRADGAPNGVEWLHVHETWVE